MNLIENIVDFLRKPRKETEGKSPEGTCPVCWGYQEYDSKLRQLFKDKLLDVNHHSDSYMKVQKFMVKYVDGIRLKQAKVEDCPTCSKQKQVQGNPMAK